MLMPTNIAGNRVGLLIQPMPQTATRSGLRHAAACPAPSHAECPTFKKLLKAAASGAIGKRAKITKPKRSIG